MNLGALCSRVQERPDVGVDYIGVAPADQPVHFLADRLAQEVARRYLEPCLEAVFHTDAYGYRPGRSAIDAVRQARQRCWR